MDEWTEHCEHTPVCTAADLLDDGTLVVTGRCLKCGQTEVVSLSIQYAPSPVLVGNYLLPMVTKRADAAVCGRCGEPIFPILSPVPVIIFITDADERVIGQVDLCAQCGREFLSDEELEESERDHSTT
jgi:hypothetical protein